MASLNTFVVVSAARLSQERDIIVLQGMWKQAIDREIAKHKGKVKVSLLVSLRRNLSWQIMSMDQASWNWFSNETGSWLPPLEYVPFENILMKYPKV